MHSDDLTILERFKGICKTGHSNPHPRGLGRRFNFILPPGSDDTMRFTKEEYVIRDGDSFLRFVSRIPEKAMVFSPAPPPNKDPLLRRPEIDFENHVALVIVSHEPNCFIDLNIVGVKLAGKARQVLCRYYEPGPVVQKILSYGTYCLAVVHRFDGDVVFVEEENVP